MPDKVFIRGVPDELWRAFKARANLEGITVAEAVRQALRDYLGGPTSSAAGDPADCWSAITAVGGSGREDVSERHDHFIAKAVSPGNDGPSA